MRVKTLMLKCLTGSLFLILAGCAASDPTPSGFLSQSGLSERGDLPFRKSWIKPGVNWDQYRNVVIAPVDTHHLLESSAWQELGRTGEIQTDIKKLALYTRTSFSNAFLTDPRRRFQLVYTTAARPGLLRVEMALTELTPNKVLLKAAGYVPLYGLAATAVNQTNPSYVSIEIRLKDARTGEVLAKFADRENEPFTIVHVDQFTWYGFAEKRVDQWAVKLVETLNRKPGQVVDRSSNFELKPW